MGARQLPQAATAADCGQPAARRSFVEPLAAGSGIPEVKTYLNGVHIRGLLTARCLVTKLSGICFSIAAGLIAGDVLAAGLTAVECSGAWSH